MTQLETAFEQCARDVRAFDENRFLASAFAPSAAQPHLMALYAFNHEVAKTAETVTQPVLGQIRLQWWRDAVEGIYAGNIRAHAVVEALAETVRVHHLQQDMLQALIEARESDLDDCPFPDQVSFHAYADATAGQLNRLALRILGASDVFDGAAHEAGIAYSMTGTVRALAYWASRGRIVLPLDQLRRAGVAEDTILAGRSSPALMDLLADILQHADDHRVALGEARMPRRYLAALLPAATAPLYRRVITKAGFDPFHDVSEVPRVRRQTAMLAAYLRGHL